MKKLIESVMQRAAILTIVLAMLLVWGTLSAIQMQRDYLPGINNTTLMVSVRTSSLQADQVKRDITAPLEEAIRRTDGMTNLETTSYDGGLLMNLYYPMNYDMDKAERDIRMALNDAELPSGVNQPVVTRLTTSTFPILSYSLTAGKTDVGDNALRSTVQTGIVNQLKTVPGVADVQTIGGAKSGYVVVIRSKDLAAAGMTLDDFNKSMASALPALQGTVANVKSPFPVRVEGWDISEQQLKLVDIKNKDGVSVPLSAVASVSQALNDVQTVSRTNGQASVLIHVIKTPGANITKVAAQVKDRVAKLPAVTNGEVSMTLTGDRAHDLNASLLGLLREGLLGCVFSMLCVFIFFRSTRSTLLIAVSLPISLLATTAVLKSIGVTLNILTVSGLIVAMGRIVDDSIVILDHMHRRMQEAKGEKNRLHILSSSVVEMLPAILGSTATTIAVYTPIALVGGIIGASYSGFAWSVVIALVVSFFVAMLVIPAFAYMGWHKPAEKAVSLDSVMKPFLRAAFRHRKTVLSASLIIFVIAAFFAARLPFSLLPSTTSGQVAVQLELPKGSALSEVDQSVSDVEKILQQDPQVDSFSATFGSSFTPQADDVFDQGGGYIQQPNVANLSVKLKDKKQINNYIESLQNKLEGQAGTAVVTVTNQNIAGDDSTINIMLSGADAATLDRAATTLRAKLAEVAGLSVVGKSDLTNGIPKYKIILDAAKVAKAGVDRLDINKILSRYMTKGKDFDISVSTGTGLIPVDVYLDPVQTGAANSGGVLPHYTAQEVLGSIGAETVKGTGGQVYRMDQLGTIEPSDAVTTIQERDGEPYSVVQARIISSDISGVSKNVKNVLKAAELPDGVSYSLGGITQQVTQMIEEMAIAVVASIALVLMITRFIFRGWRAAISVLISIPLALSGVVLGLYAVHGQWNLAALIGVLMLTGIVVTNGIVLIDKIERNYRSGLSLDEAVMSGGLSRVRPILMTAATTVLTLIPLAFSGDDGAVISKVLGIVVIGGMITSTLNSFVVIPILYKALHQRKNRKTEQS